MAVIPKRDDITPYRKCYICDKSATGFVPIEYSGWYQGKYYKDLAWIWLGCEDHLKRYESDVKQLARMNSQKEYFIEILEKNK